jgi:hypothetical protein
MDRQALLSDKRIKPGMEQLRTYMDRTAFEAFEQFNQILLNKYNLGYVVPRFTKTQGWVYAYGRSGCICISKVAFMKSFFVVDEIVVSELKDLPEALRYVDEVFRGGFLIKFAQFDDKRTARRRQKEKVNALVDETQYKKNCRWPDKVSRNDLRRLYQSNAAGRTDTELLEEIGATIAVRCMQAKHIYDLMEQGKILCTSCGEILSGRGVLTCGCGLNYTYHAYRKAFREDNMPRGAASRTFDLFVADWENTRTMESKMRLIDNLIHAFHIAAISGKQGRPVGVNLISGTKTQVIALIEELSCQ